MPEIQNDPTNIGPEKELSQPGQSQGAELAKELEQGFEHDRQLSELKTGILKNIFLEAIDKAQKEGALDRSLPFYRKEFEKLTSLITPEDHHMDHSLQDEIDAIKLLLNYELLGKESAQPELGVQAASREAMHDFTDKAKNDSPTAVEKVKQLWYKFTRKSGADINDAERVFDNEHNKEGTDTLRQARAQLAALRAFERRTAIRRLDEGELEAAERQYKEAFKEHLLKELEQLKKVEKAEGREINQEVLRTIAVQHLIDEMQRRSNMEAAILEARGGTGLGKVNWFRKHPKIRVAVGLALTGGAITAGVAGAGLPAIAFGGARLGMRAFGGYDAAQNLQERWGARRDHSLNKEHDETRNVTGQNLENLSSEEQTQLMANLLATKASIGASEKYKSEDNKILQQLTAERSNEYKELFEALQQKFTGINFLRGIEGGAAIFLTEQLKAENARLGSDKEVGSKRFKRAAVIGAAIAVLPLGSLVDHTLGRDGGKNGISAEKYGKAPSDSVFNQPSESQSNGAADYRPNGDSDERPRLRFADREWKIQPGESQWRIAHEIMNYHPKSFGELDPQQKMVAVDRLKDLMGGKDLIYPGDIQEVKGAWVRDAIETGRNYK